MNTHTHNHEHQTSFSRHGEETSYFTCRRAGSSWKCVLPHNFDYYENYRGLLADPINISAKNRPNGREDGRYNYRGTFPQNSLLKGEDMRADVGQDVFVFRVVGEGFPRPVNSSSPTSRIHAHLRAHARKRHYFSSPLRGALHPSRRRLPRHLRLLVR